MCELLKVYIVIMVKVVQPHDLAHFLVTNLSAKLCEGGFYVLPADLSLVIHIETIKQCVYFLLGQCFVEVDSAGKELGVVNLRIQIIIYAVDELLGLPLGNLNFGVTDRIFQLTCVYQAGVVRVYLLEYFI